MTAAELLSFMREHLMAVQASVSTSGAAQAAAVGIVVTDDFEILFDTVDESRKVENLRRNPRIAFVIGGMAAGDERTVQYEGLADEPTGAELERLKQLYFASFPDGRERQDWPGITYVRARPIWIRYSDFNPDPPEIIEFDRAGLGLD
jgi:general stress protein 26